MMSCRTFQEEDPELELIAVALDQGMGEVDCDVEGEWSGRRSHTGEIGS